MSFRSFLFLHLKENPAFGLLNGTAEFNLSQSVLPMAEVNPPSFTFHFECSLTSCMFAPHCYRITALQARMQIHVKPSIAALR